MATRIIERASARPPLLQRERRAAPAAEQWLRVHLTYLWRHRRLLSLDAPERLTELIQHRKLFDHDPRFPTLIDKLGAKSFVEDRLGETWVTPTRWTGTTLPETASWARPFVVKSRHGCNQRRFVRSEMDDWSAIRRASARWMRSGYGQVQREGDVIHVIAKQLTDLSPMLSTLAAEQPVRIELGRGDGAKTGGGPDPRDGKRGGLAGRDIYIPPLHLDDFKGVKARNFR